MGIIKYFLLVTLIFANISYAQEYKSINVCSEAGFFPFEMRTVTGEWKGYDIALVTEFAKDTGRKIKLTDIKFDGLIPALITKKGCDMVVSAVGINAQREKIVLFSEATYQSAYAGIIRLKDANKFKKYEDINKKDVSISVQQGTEAADYVKKRFANAIILSFEDNSAPINAVIAGKVDIYIDDSVYASIAVKRKISNLALVPPDVFPANKYSGMGFLFRKGDEKFRDEFNKFYNKIKNNGELARIQKYYFEDMGWLKDFPVSQ